MRLKPKMFLFCFTKILNQALYMTHTFEIEVSLHYWLLWPTVCHGQLTSNSNFWWTLPCRRYVSLLACWYDDFKPYCTCSVFISLDLSHLCDWNTDMILHINLFSSFPCSKTIPQYKMVINGLISWLKEHFFVFLRFFFLFQF